MKRSSKTFGLKCDVFDLATNSLGTRFIIFKCTLVLLQVSSAVYGVYSNANMRLAHAAVHSAIWQRYLKPSGGAMEKQLHVLMAGL